MKAVPDPVAAMVDDASAAAGVASPFWATSDPMARETALYELAFDLDVEDRGRLLAALPDGYAATQWIFTWEQDRAGEGFGTGVANCGVAAVEQAASWYARLGMPEEARALHAMLAQYAQTPEDYEKIDAAYNTVENPYREDWDRIPRAVEILCDGAEGYFLA